MDGIFIMGLFRGIDSAMFVITWMVLVCFSICVHELAHAWVALKEGDDTAARAGHLSLNPLVQMGPTSILLLMFLGLAWGAVPVDRSRFRHRYSNALISFAGPAANIALMLFFSILFGISMKFSPDPQTSFEIVFRNIGLLGAMLNAVLFILNMLPIPILDGWHVYSYAFPKMERIDPIKAQLYCMIALFVILMSPVIQGWMWGAGGAAAYYLGNLWLALLNLLMPS